MRHVQPCAILRTKVAAVYIYLFMSAITPHLLGCGVIKIVCMLTFVVVFGHIGSEPLLAAEAVLGVGLLAAIVLGMFITTVCFYVFLW